MCVWVYVRERWTERQSNRQKCSHIQNRQTEAVRVFVNLSTHAHGRKRKGRHEGCMTRPAPSPSTSPCCARSQDDHSEPLNETGIRGGCPSLTRADKSKPETNPIEISGRSVAAINETLIHEIKIIISHEIKGLYLMR